MHKEVIYLTLCLRTIAQDVLSSTGRSPNAELFFSQFGISLQSFYVMSDWSNGGFVFAFAAEPHSLVMSH